MTILPYHDLQMKGMYYMRVVPGINEILKDFYKISGARISIHDSDYNEIYAYPKKLCDFCCEIQKSNIGKTACLDCDRKAFETVKNDNKTVFYRCRFGLNEAASPIYHYGIIVGYLMIGQVCTNNDGIALVKQRSKKFSSDSDKLCLCAENIKIIPDDLFKSYANIMNVLADHFAANGAFLDYSLGLAELINLYLNKNYQSKINLDIICAKFGCCKSTAQNAFKKKYGCTVVSHLNNIRLENARIIINDTNKSFKEIAAECGFYDQNYFSKMFSKKFGCSPKQYKKNIAK